METRYLNAVLAVARYGSFTRAATTMFMSQSTLSRQIGAVERELGAPLFERGVRSASLTVLGQAFLPEARTILDAVGRAEAAASPAGRRRQRRGAAAARLG